MALFGGLARYLSLEPRDRWLIAHAWLSLGIVDLGLRAVGFRGVVARVSIPADGPIGSQDVRR
ncbi:MAG: hypothetical protein M3O34_17930, partial [Chloroflexota bacterium]|nr:hypothetical protein [Chloroflexota bacterium]